MEAQVSMTTYGFTALDTAAQCSISAGAAGGDALKDLAEIVLNGVARKVGGVAGGILAIIATNLDSFVEGFRDGWNQK